MTESFSVTRQREPHSIKIGKQINLQGEIVSIIRFFHVYHID